MIFSAGLTILAPVLVRVKGKLTRQGGFVLRTLDPPCAPSQFADAPPKKKLSSTAPSPDFTMSLLINCKQRPRIKL